MTTFINASHCKFWYTENMVIIICSCKIITTQHIRLHIYIITTQSMQFEITLNHNTVSYTHQCSFSDTFGAWWVLILALEHKTTNWYQSQNVFPNGKLSLWVGKSKSEDAPIAPLNLNLHAENVHNITLLNMRTPRSPGLGNILVSRLALACSSLSLLSQMISFWKCSSWLCSYFHLYFRSGEEQGECT